MRLHSIAAVAVILCSSSDANEGRRVDCVSGQCSQAALCLRCAASNPQACLLQTLRRRIDGLSKQKSDTKASLAEAKASCDNKADANCSLKSQIRVGSLHLLRSVNLWLIV